MRSRPELRQPIAGFIAAGFAALCALASPPVATGQGQPGKPPPELGESHCHDRMERMGTLYVTGSPRHLLCDRSVYLSHLATGDPRSWEPLAQLPERFEVPFWPTATAMLDATTLAVAGRGRDPQGRATTIEVWRVTEPQLRWRAPGGALVERSNGATPELYGSRVLSKVVVYEEATPGRDLVRLMARLRGRPASLLVQFHDSGDVYELDYRDALGPSPPPPGPLYPLTPLLRATAGSDAPWAPQLADGCRTWISGATHRQQGCLYFLWCSYEMQLESRAAAPLTLVDADCDGRIDAWRCFSAEQNEALGHAQYVEKGLCRGGW